MAALHNNDWNFDLTKCQMDWSDLTLFLLHLWPVYREQIEPFYKLLYDIVKGQVVDVGIYNVDMSCFLLSAINHNLFEQKPS